MKTIATNLAILTLFGLMLTAVGGKTKNPPIVISAPQELRYNVEYTCGGERVTVGRCRRDSDQPGYPATPPERDYCAVYYPDRPKRNGFMVQTVELRGDVVKKLQACGALETDQRTGAVSSAADNYLKQGNGYLAAKDYAKAIEAYNQALAVEPSTTAAYYGLGVSYKSLKQYPKAVSAFKEFLRAQPNNTDALTQLGFTYVFMDQNENAVASLRQVIRLKPDADVYGPLGLAYLGLKQYADAVAAFKEAVRQKPKVGQSYYFLGYAYLSMGKKEDALQVYRTLQTVDKTQAQKLYDLINKATPASVPADDEARLKKFLDKDGGYKTKTSGYFNPKEGTYTDQDGGVVDNWRGYTYKDGSYKTQFGDYYDAPTKTYKLADGTVAKVENLTAADAIKALRDNVEANDGYDKDFILKSMYEQIRLDHPAKPPAPPKKN